MATEPAVIGTDAGWNNSLHIVGTHIWFGTNGTKVYHSTDLGVTWTYGATTGTVNTYACLLYTSDAADERSSVDLGGRRIIKKKKKKKKLR